MSLRKFKGGDKFFLGVTQLVAKVAPSATEYGAAVAGSGGVSAMARRVLVVGNSTPAKSYATKLDVVS